MVSQVFDPDKSLSNAQSIACGAVGAAAGADVLPPPNTDTSEPSATYLRRIAALGARDRWSRPEQQVPLASAMVRATGAGVCDSTTVLMVIASANQAEYQHSNQLLGCGFRFEA